jgi:hypothetical protein
MTTLIVGCASVCVLSYLTTSGTRWAPVGVVGALAVIVPTTTALILVWRDWDDDADVLWRTFGVGVVCALTLAQICLLLVLAARRRNLRLVLSVTVVLAVVLALTISGSLVEVIQGDLGKFIGIVAILDVLGTLVTIALAKFVGREESTEDLAAHGIVRVTLGGDQSAEVERLARATGRRSDELVAEAVDRFLHAADRA